jgi:putative peptidoglycan lipid II flippase
MTSDSHASPAADSSSTPPVSLARSAGVAGAATLTSRVLGLARETVQAAVFGAGNDMDAFTVAFRIPNLVRDLFAEGAMSASFVPTFTRCLAQRGRPDAWRLANNVLTALLLVTGVIVVLGLLFAAPLIALYADDYARVPGKLELTIVLTRVMLPFLTLVAIAAAVMGMLNALRHYFVPALSPAAFNVASIASALLLAPWMPAIGQPPIMALAIGALLGGFGQVALQWSALRREGYRYRPALDARDPGLRQVLLLMGPGTIGLAATQINLLVTTVLAVREGTGAVSWLQYGFRVIYLPIGVFGISIATAVLPAVSRQLAAADRDAARATVTRGVALMLIVNLPATVGLFLLAEPIVRLLLERGRFLPGDTLATASAVQLYAVGLVGYSAARIASPVFYAFGESRIAVAISATAIAVNLGLSVWLVRIMGFSGLALATSLAAIVNGALSLIVLRSRLDGLEERELGLTLVKVVGTSFAMAIAVEAAWRGVAAMVPGDGAASQALRLSVAIAAALITVAAAGHAFGIAEMRSLLQNIRRRVRAALGR